MWNIDDNKMLFKSYKYEDNNVVCESNINFQQKIQQLEDYFYRLAYSNGDTVCISIVDGEFKIIELDDLKDSVIFFLNCMVQANRRLLSPSKILLCFSWRDSGGF